MGQLGKTGQIAGITLCLAMLVNSANAQPQSDQNWDHYPAIYELDEWSLDWSPVHGLRVEAHRIVRVQRTTGSDVGRIRIWDTFFQRLIEFEGEVRDTLGNVQFSVGLEDVRTVAPFVEFRLYSGDAVRSVDLIASQTPYIVEARWKVEIDNPFFWPDWVLSDQFPRRRGVYTVAIPRDREIQFREAHLDLQRSHDRTARRNITSWELRNWEPGNGTVEEANSATPLVHVAPVEFRVERLKGRSDSWEALGQWYWELTGDRFDLEDEQRATVQSRMGDYFGDRARASALKDWVSDDWRYVAIEVGIGGWRPNWARDVFDNRYGDCKDVVFLWVAMMREAGLEAHPALVRARDPLPIDPGFPKDWFDHVIALAVIDGDTLWADLSDSRYPLGTLPPRCEARWALVVSDSGGHLVRTPSGEATTNLLTTHTEGQLDTDGSLTFRSRVTASGHFAYRLPLHSETDRTRAVAITLGISPTALEGQMDGFRVIGSDSISVSMSGRIAGWALADADQIQMRPRVAGWAAADTLAGRPDPGEIPFRMTAFDTLIVHFPPGWLPELWPATPFHSEAAGEMGDVRSFQKGTLTILRHARWSAPGRTPPDLRAAARLRRSFKEARDAEWLFRRVEIGGDRDREPGDASPAENTSDTSAVPSAHEDTTMPGR